MVCRPTPALGQFLIGPQQIEAQLDLSVLLGLNVRWSYCLEQSGVSTKRFC